MLKNLNIDIHQVNGEKIIQDGKAANLKTFVIEALMASAADDRTTGAQKFGRYQLATKISAAGDGEVELTPEEMVQIKEFVGKIYGPLVVGHAYKALD